MHLNWNFMHYFRQLWKTPKRRWKFFWKILIINLDDRQSGAQNNISSAIMHVPSSRASSIRERNLWRKISFRKISRYLFRGREQFDRRWSRKGIEQCLFSNIYASGLKFQRFNQDKKMKNWRSARDNISTVISCVFLRHQEHGNVKNLWRIFSKNLGRRNKLLYVV